jgi:hypothetical protein
VWDFLSNLNPADGTFYGIAPDENGRPVLMGQMCCPPGAAVARLNCVMPGSKAVSGIMSELMDYLAARAGEWGSLYLTAEVDEQSPVFEALRRACFTVYTRQRVWQFIEGAASKSNSGSPKHSWQTMNSVDRIAVRNLLQSIVPPLAQPLEPHHDARLNGLVLREGGELLAYTEVLYGPRGIWVQPFIHPATEAVPELLQALRDDLSHRAGRPLYLGVRAYQAWLEPILQDLGASVGPRQALMVRRLAIEQKVSARVHLPALEKQRAEPSAPFTRAVKVNPKGLKDL